MTKYGSDSNAYNDNSFAGSERMIDFVKPRKSFLRRHSETHLQGEGDSCRETCRIASIRSVITLFQLGVLTGALFGFIVANMELGSDGNWGFSFLLAFLPIPVFFGICLTIGICLRERVFACLSVWACVLAFGFSFPAALVSNKIAVVEPLAPWKGDNVADVNCWVKPPNATLWKNSVEFVHWADDNYKIDRSRMQASWIVDGSNVYTFCAAPIEYTGKGVQPCPFCAYAICYELRTSQTLCSDTALKNCAWDFNSSKVISQVLRPRTFYQQFTDDDEFNGYKTAIGKVSPGGCDKSIYEQQPVAWFGDTDPYFFQNRDDVLWNGLDGSLLGYICGWGSVALIGGILNVVVPTRRRSIRWDP
eukprot:TRINITY_DN41722_c0_g1_i1.p1 TRINITY_DN41722_c0_g1~~TRINITY_DN41722_c0_g1_i1.p1  ORF type:complete len:362 (-),score=47.64 TRINITY_DN41722_c0_g1_i1:18-1103(-)